MMTMSQERNRYFLWLSKRVAGRGCPQDGLSFLADLHGIPFYWLIEKDANRASDGVRLRDYYMNEMHLYTDEEDTAPCSLLEMLIALAERMNFNLPTSENLIRTSEIFWDVFIRNLRLEVYGEQDRYLERKRNHNGHIIRIFLDRHYMPDGKGGLFPLNKPRKDQTNVEIWYQMMAYLDENYPNS